MATVCGLYDGRKEILRRVFRNAAVATLQLRLFINDFTPSIGSRLGAFSEPYLDPYSPYTASLPYADWSFSRPGDYCLAQCASKSITLRHKVKGVFTACTVYGWFLALAPSTTARATAALAACRLDTPIEVSAAGATFNVAPYFQVAGNGFFTSYGEEYAARKLCGQGFTTLWIYGYTNDYTPTKNSVKADFLYTPATPGNAAWVPATIAIESIPDSQRVRGCITPGTAGGFASGDSVYGFVVLNNAETDVVCAARQPEPFYTLAGLGASPRSLGIWAEAL